MPTQNKPYGLVLCGGESSRMGIDKSKIIYHNKQQRYHFYDLLQNFCSEVFISCNSAQLQGIDKDYQTLVDLAQYENSGPISALLTAFKKYPSVDFLVVGCDYPFLAEDDIREFFTSINENQIASTFFNAERELYVPVIGWYTKNSADVLRDQFQSKQYSLQYFLRSANAQKFIPPNSLTILSADTPEQSKYVLDDLQKLKTHL